MSNKINSNSKDHFENLSLFIEDDLIKIDFEVKKLPKYLLTEAKKLLPNSNYIGFSVIKIKLTEKSWSIYKFISLANKVSSIKKIPVFFINKKRN